MGKACSVKPDNQNMLLWVIVLDGPAGSAYEKGKFTLELKFPETYPMKAPQVTFKTKIYHPQIETKSGDLCNRVLEGDWAPTLNVIYVIEKLLTLLKDPSKEDFVEAEIAEELAKNKKKFEDNARKWT